MIVSCQTRLNAGKMIQRVEGLPALSRTCLYFRQKLADVMRKQGSVRRGKISVDSEPKCV